MGLLATWLSALSFWGWWIIAALLMALEMFFPGAIFLWIGVAAGVVGLLLLLMPELSPQWQWALFALLSVVSVIGAKRFWHGRAVEGDRPTLNRRGEQYVGRHFTLEHAIVNGFGRLHVDDSMWKIAGPDLPAGTPVRIAGTDGTTLKVERA